MQRKHITDQQVIDACSHPKGIGAVSSLDWLMAATGAPGKVCLAAMDRAMRRGLIECGVSVVWAWATGRQATPTGS